MSNHNNNNNSNSCNHKKQFEKEDDDDDYIIDFIRDDSENSSVEENTNESQKSNNLKRKQSNGNQHSNKKIKKIDLTKSIDAITLETFLHILESEGLRVQENKSSLVLKNYNRVVIQDGLQGKIEKFRSTYKSEENHLVLKVPGDSLTARIFEELIGLLPKYLRRIIKVGAPRSTPIFSSFGSDGFCQLYFKFDRRNLIILKRTFSREQMELRTSISSSLLDKLLPYVLCQLIGEYIDGEHIKQIPFEDLFSSPNLTVSQVELELHGLKVDKRRFWGKNAVTKNSIVSVMFDEYVQ